ncbi:MAG: nuclear transport factor 2 family protein [Ilumatobacter sp.]|uniref:nuclear transport factor 2 family protein n=1 Tax=Ilumatobacter sp. TaxID=1967498 RepID=UPI002625D6E2|nr:nuclear transport factor 2 family protein [Ilumatobacter sp.]MDJ0770115.1 nuclear transport factor 2 family protein [Ilumatobacter sp.]
METLTIDLNDLGRTGWTPEEQANAALVAEFVRLLMNEHDFEAVRDRFGSGAYLQHNHGIADGIEGVLETIGRLVKRFPDYAYDVKHILVDGDIVTFHSHATLRRSHRGNPRKGFNITDRWRVVEGNIVEHWDSIQPIDLFARFYILVSGGRVRNDNGTY